MKRLSTFGKHAREIGTYVYRLIDPRSGHTFYVGKGRGDRVFAHAQNQLKGQESAQDDGENEDYLSEKNKRISDILADNLEVHYVIHRHSMETVAQELIEDIRSSKDTGQSLLTSVADKIAYEVEAALIDAYEGLSNIANGHGNSERGCQHVEQLQAKYQKEPLIPMHRLIAFSVGNSRKTNDDLTDAVRLAWRASLEKAKSQEYVLAHDSGQVIEVFEVNPDDWLEATPENFPGEISHQAPEEESCRTSRARIGIRKGQLKLAPADIRDQYINRILPPSRTTNPVRYFGQDEDFS